jgi:hypothetical protein
VEPVYLDSLAAPWSPAPSLLPGASPGLLTALSPSPTYYCTSLPDPTYGPLYADGLYSEQVREQMVLRELDKCFIK